MSFSSTLSFRLAALVLFALPASAFAQGTEEQQQACTPDAVKLCSDTIPDIPKTTACMKAHFSQLSPRCQSAFNDATGGKPTTRTATRKVEPQPRTHIASHGERHVATGEVPEGNATVARSHSANGAAESEVPQVAGFPPFPSPDAPLVHAKPATGPRAQIAAACRAGLIDSFTCQNTVPVLLGPAE